MRGRLALVLTLAGSLAASALPAPAWAGKKPAAEPAPPAFESFESVPYAKFTNSAFAKDFEGKWVKVDCTFAGTDTQYDGKPLMARSAGVASSTDVFFLINRPDAPAGETTTTPLGAFPAGYAGVYVPKEASDPVFALSAGQRITVYGYGKRYATGTLAGPNAASTDFAILEVVKIEPTAAP